MTFDWVTRIDSGSTIRESNQQPIENKSRVGCHATSAAKATGSREVPCSGYLPAALINQNTSTRNTDIEVGMTLPGRICLMFKLTKQLLRNKHRPGFSQQSE